MSRGLILLLVVSSGLAWAQVPFGIEPRSKAADRLDASFTRLDAQFIGMEKCAGCHGAAEAKSLTQPADDQTWRSSLTHVLAVDPHGKSFDVLSNNRSKRITQHLRKHSTVEIPEATNDHRCLACHVTPQLVTNDRLSEQAKFGVSCEACHGSAKDWLTTHTTWTPDSRESGIKRSGFVDLNRADVRLRTCGGCHIGSPDSPTRDMNHDMIAGGHPALAKSLDELMKKYPKHWQEKSRGPAVSISVADIEQLAREILSKDRQARNARKDTRTVWPEFAEQSCTSCHRGLQSPGLSLIEPLTPPMKPD